MELALPGMTAAARNTAVQQAVTEHGKKLLDFIRYRISNPADAEDLLQDVFLQFSRTLENPEPIEKVSSWLFTAARNRIIDFYRKKKDVTFSSFAQDSDGDEDTLIEPFDFLQSNNSSPADEYTKKLFWQALEAGLETLPMEQRMVFEMHELQGISFNDIQEITGEPLKTLLSRKHYAVKKLRAHLADFYTEWFNN